MGKPAGGTVSGTVMDNSGAIIFGGAVELTNHDTGVVRTTVTNSAGIYRFDAVDLGIYKIKISMQGFKSFLYERFPVAAKRTVTIDAALETGGIESVVEVGEEMIEASLIRDAPLRGGSFDSSEWLERKLTANGISFTKHDNVFLRVEDWERNAGLALIHSTEDSRPR